jgi:hypothetical protein
MMEKDYSPLRPFDLEAAKRGDAICWSGNGSFPGKYLAGPDKANEIAFQDSDGDLYVAHTEKFAMAPLAWVEGRPVYRGDVLWCRFGNRHVIVKVDGDQVWFESETWLDRKELTWTPPAVKRHGWVNIYPKNENRFDEAVANSGGVYASKDDADRRNHGTRIACVRIEWDEPAEASK